MEIPTDGLIVLWCFGLLVNPYWAPLYMLSSLPLFSVFLIAHVVSQGRALGFGDVLLVVAVAPLLSLAYLFLGVYVGIIIGGVISLLLLLTKRVSRKAAIAFGPFLAIGFYGMVIVALL